MPESLLQWVLLAGGVTLIYAALLLHETEEERLQRGLDAAWVRVDDVRASAVRLQKSFVSSLSARIGRWLDRGLGHLVSPTAMSVSLCLSLTGLLIGPLRLWGDDLQSSGQRWAVALAGLALPPFFLRRTLWRRTWLVSALAACSAFVLLHQTWRGVSMGPAYVFDGSTGEVLPGPPLVPDPAVPSVAVGYFVGLAGGVLSDLAFFVSLRALLRWNASSGGLLSSLSFLLVSWGFPWLVIGGPLQLSQRVPALERIGFVMAGSNFNIALLSQLAMLLGVILVAHPVLWLVLSRPLYAAARYRIIQQKKILGLAGVALIGAASPPVGAALRSLVKTLGL